MSVRDWKAEVGSEELRDMKLYMSSTRDVMSLVDSLEEIQSKERKELTIKYWNERTRDKRGQGGQQPRQMKVGVCRTIPWKAHCQAGW